MRLVSIDSINSGDKNVFPVLSSDGRRILSANTSLSERYVKRLKEMGIEYIYKVDEEFSNISVNHPISPQIRSKALKVYKSIIDSISKEKDIDADSLKDVSKQIVEDTKSNGLPIMLLDGLYPEENTLAVHAINTAILSTCLGIQLSYNFSQLCEICISGFIHDIARKTIADDNKSNHTQAGFDILRKVPTLSVTSTAVALQHHENFDGSGFPRSIKGSDISQYSRIVSVADYFDTLISGQGIKPMSHARAFGEIYNNENIKFDPEVVKAFKNVVQVYFNGSMVVLKDGRQGVVVEQNKGKPLRPIVKIISNSNLEKVDLIDKVDLAIDNLIL